MRFEHFLNEEYKECVFTQCFAKYAMELDKLPFYSGEWISTLDGSSLDRLRLMAKEGNISRDLGMLALALYHAENGDWELELSKNINDKAILSHYYVLCTITRLEVLHRLGLIKLVNPLSIMPNSEVKYLVTDDGMSVHKLLSLSTRV